MSVTVKAENEMITERVEHEMKQFMERVLQMGMMTEDGKQHSNSLNDFKRTALVEVVILHHIRGINFNEPMYLIP